MGVRVQIVAVVDATGKKAKVKFTSRLDYYPFKLKEDAGVIAHTRTAAAVAGFTPRTICALVKLIRTGFLSGSRADARTGRLAPTASFSPGDHPWPRHPRSDAMPRFLMSR